MTPKRNFWRAKPVTVCIAALAEDGKKIVMASDSKAAFGEFSADKGVIKNIPLKNGYAVMLAGNDVGDAMPTLRRAKVQIGNSRDADEIANCLHEALVETRRQKVEAKILSKLGFTVETFRTEGKDSLTESAYYDVVSEIRRMELSLTFLLCGFDELGEGHLRVVASDDSPQDCDMLGFAAIGSGASAALSSLSFTKDHCNFYPSATSAEVFYYVLAAKFMAESATDVGKDTFDVCLVHGAGCEFLSPYAGGSETVRDAWLEKGAPRKSAEAIEAISSMIYGGNTGLSAKDAELLIACRPHVSPDRQESIDVIVRQQLTSDSSEDQPSAYVEEFPETES
jgi:ATP-dependent protease HslVU (ClpYQ) peptidase subunit